MDGVCVVPAEAETEVLAKALEKVRGERLVKKALEEGTTAVEAFHKYGVI
jgi:regulator of RNase E activity RraA